MFREFAVSRSGLASAIEYVMQTCADQGLGDDIAHPLCVILDETVGNLMAHSALTEKDFFYVGITAQGCECALTIRDRGAAFDPVHWPPDGRKGPGGFGIQLIKSLAHDVRYERMEDSNQLTATVRPKAPG